MYVSTVLTFLPRACLRAAALGLRAAASAPSLPGVPQGQTLVLPIRVAAVDKQRVFITRLGRNFDILILRGTISEDDAKVVEMRALFGGRWVC